MWGLLGSAAIKGLKAGSKAYSEGRGVLPEGVGKGFLKSWDTIKTSLDGAKLDGQMYPRLAITSAGTLFTGGVLIGVSYAGQSYGWVDSHTAKILRWSGLGFLAAGAITTLLTSSGGLKAIVKNIPAGSAKVSSLQKAGGYSLMVSKGLVIDVGWRSLSNLAVVIAPLMGATELASLVSKKVLLPSAATTLERSVGKSILGQFYMTPLDAYKQRDMTLATGKKYKDNIADFNNAKTLFGKAYRVGNMFGRGYLAGFYGVWMRQDLENLGDTQLNNLAKDRGLDKGIIIDEKNDKAQTIANKRSQIIASLAGTSRVERILAKNGKSLSDPRSWFAKEFKSNWYLPSQQSIYFSVALTFLNPVAESVLNNIKAGNIGLRFQAATHAWETAIEGMLPRSHLKKLSESAGKWSSFQERVSDTFWSGVLEEQIQEDVVDTVFLRLIPFSAFMPVDMAMQVREVLQEVIMGKAGVPKLTHKDAIRILKNNGNAKIVTVDLVQMDRKKFAEAQKLVEAIKGQFWKDTGKYLRQMSELFYSGDKLIIADGDQLRTIVVGEGKE